MFGFANDAPRLRPALTRAVEEILIQTLGFSGDFAPRLSLGQLGSQDALQAGIARQAEDEIHLVLFAPGHQLFAREPRVRSEDDDDLRPLATDMRDDPLDLLDRSRRSVDIGAPQPSAQ